MLDLADRYEPLPKAATPEIKPQEKPDERGMG
jgi:hypothetical protein